MSDNRKDIEDYVSRSNRNPYRFLGGRYGSGRYSIETFIISFLAAAVTFGLVGFFTERNIIDLQNHGIRVDGTIVNITEEYQSGGRYGGHDVYYASIVASDSKSRTLRFSIDITKQNRHIGDKVTVIYSPQNLDAIIDQGDDNLLTAHEELEFSFAMLLIGIGLIGWRKIKD